MNTKKTAIIACLIVPLASFAQPGFLAQQKRITERQITPAEYVQYLQQADPAKVSIHKRRKCFVWENQYFEIDTFVNPTLPFALLEIEDVEQHEAVNFPPFIKVIEDVTDNKEFYNSNLVKIKEK